MEPKVTAIYVRVSTETQKEEGYSIEAQTEKLQAYCVAKGYNHRELYVDGGYTGSNINRPELQRLVTDIKNGRIERVLVYKLDRLSRSQKDTLYLIEDTFNPNGVDFISLSESLDTSTPLGRLMIGILSAFAQLERENIKERLQMGNIQRVKNGFWKGGGCVPFGFDYDKKRGFLVKNNDAERVKQMYELYLQGYSTKKIAAIVGVKYQSQVRDCLRRKTNTGIFEYCGKVYESKNEQIVSQEVYQQAMDLMQQRAKVKQTDGVNLLAGILFCGKCGARIRYKYNRATGYNGLVCYSITKDHHYMIKDPNCDNQSITWRKVEKAVIDDLFLIQTTQTKNPHIETIKESIIDILNKQHDTTNKQLKNLYLLYASSTDSMLLEAIEDTKKKLLSLSNQITAEQERNVVLGQIANYTKELATIKDAWYHMTPKEKKDILRAFINKIVLTDGDIEIFYKFNRQQYNQ